jgi:P pilus assembly chaperone PapD
MVWSRSKTVIGIAAWMGIVLAGSVLDSRASGLVIAPTRVMFEGRSRVATVYLTNRSDAPATYRIMLRDKRMLETGQIVDLEGPAGDERPASELVRYSPRRVTLEPGGSQTIRLMLRNLSEGKLEKGEYRTHLVFQSVPDLTGEEDRMIARAVLETTIPVIIRRDNPQAEVALAHAAMDTTVMADGRPTMRLSLERSGLRSVYGDLTVEWIVDGRPTLVAKLAGLGVYHPTPRRNMLIPLTLPSGATLDHGHLAIRFEETALGLGDLSCETSLDLVPEETVE